MNKGTMDSPDTQKLRRPLRKSTENAIEKIHLWTKRIRTAITCDKYDDEKAINSNTLRNVRRTRNPRKPVKERQHGDLQQVSSELKIVSSIGPVSYKSEMMTESKGEKKELIKSENVNGKSGLNKDMLDIAVTDEAILATNTVMHSTPQPNDIVRMYPKHATDIVEDNTSLTEGMNQEVNEIRISKEIREPKIERIYITEDGVQTPTPLWGEIYDRLLDFNFGNVTNGIAGYSEDVFKELGLKYD
ncbi:unnamed protein product [Allacma fusca]|uniref:Uncharacterized protein n=1 Tax=Allacma fusca TaxID=39272 RepID=A0A8J2L608_9HEXA|nr:unnamed protein product [Allacma fusca]